jgi:hypothetical protein
MKQLIIFLVLFNFLSLLFAQWESVFLFDAGGFYYASSELEEPSNPMDIGRYSPKNLLDHDSATAWVEGEKDSGTGAYVFLGIGTSLQDNIIVYNGYQQTENLFKKNNRVKDLKLTFYIGFSNKEGGQYGVDLNAAAYEETALITLQDKPGPQIIDFPFRLEEIKAFREREHDKYMADYKIEETRDNSPKEVLFVKFEIQSVYRGSTWDDTCIAEIEFSNREIGEFLPLNESIVEVYQDDNSGNILIQTSENKVLILANAQNIAREKEYSGEGEFFSLNLLDVSPDNCWAVIDYQHGFTGGGHIEETHQLWSVLKMEIVPDSILQAYGVSPFDALTIISKNNRFYLNTSEGKKILLEDLQQDIEQLSRY